MAAGVLLLALLHLCHLLLQQGPVCRHHSQVQLLAEGRAGQGMGGLSNNRTWGRGLEMWHERSCMMHKRQGEGKAGSSAELSKEVGQGGGMPAAIHSPPSLTQGPDQTACAQQEEHCCMHPALQSVPAPAATSNAGQHWGSLQCAIWSHFVLCMLMLPSLSTQREGHHGHNGHTCAQGTLCMQHVYVVGSLAAACGATSVYGATSQHL